MRFLPLFPLLALSLFALTACEQYVEENSRNMQGYRSYSSPTLTAKIDRMQDKSYRANYAPYAGEEPDETRSGVTIYPYDAPRPYQYTSQTTSTVTTSTSTVEPVTAAPISPPPSDSAYPPMMEPGY